jgi:hypothetical protein
MNLVYESICQIAKFTEKFTVVNKRRLLLGFTYILSTYSRKIAYFLLLYFEFKI